MSAPTTSIVILTRNELPYTRACVDSINRCTPEPFELVFVDNGSTDGTVQYLEQLDGAIVIVNATNLGFGGGCNQGIAASTGERILLLNNDVVVTDGWLASLHAALDESPTTGIAGPRSNRVAGIQQADEVGYDTHSLDGLSEWAETWRKQHAGRRTMTSRLIGFCMLIKREVIEQVGGFDLRYGIGNFEDDDLSLRAGVAGFSLVVAHDSWIHHAGSRTFAAEGIDYSASMAENYRRFRTAWRMEEGDVDAVSGAYRPDRILARTTFERARHCAPIMGVPDSGERLDIGAARSTIVGVCCDRRSADDTYQILHATLSAYCPADDVTVAIRIDPRDKGSYVVLDEVADLIGDESLPDIAIVTISDENDTALLTLADTIVVHGRTAAAVRINASLYDTAVMAAVELTPSVTRREAA